MGKRRDTTQAKKSKEALDRKTVTAIVGAADRVYDRIMEGQKPSMTFPLRSLSNVRYDKDAATSRSAARRRCRTLTVNTVKTFAQTLRMMALSKELVETNDFATKREAYYQSQELGGRRVRRAARVRHGDGRHRGALLGRSGSTASSCASSPTSTAARSPASWS